MSAMLKRVTAKNKSPVSDLARSAIGGARAPCSRKPFGPYPRSYSNRPAIRRCLFSRRGRVSDFQGVADKVAVRLNLMRWNGTRLAAGITQDHGVRLARILPGVKKSDP